MHKQRLSPIIPGLAALVAAMPSVALAEDATVQSVKISEDSSAIVIELSSSAEGSAVSSFLRQDPLRIAVDIVDANIDSDWVLESDRTSTNIADIQAEQFDDDNGKIVRVEIYLKSEFDHVLKSNGNQVVVSLSAKGSDPLADSLGGGDDLVLGGSAG